MTSHIRAFGRVLFGGIGMDGSLGRSHGGWSGVYGVAWNCPARLWNLGQTSSWGKRDGVFTVAFICSSLESIKSRFFRIFSHWNYLQSSSAFHLHLCTLFENHPKCRIGIFQFWHFSSIFVILKLSYLVTLSDSKFWHFWWTFVHSRWKLSSLRSQFWMRLLCGFQTPCIFVWMKALLKKKSEKVFIPKIKRHLHSVLLRLESELICSSIP